MRMLALGFLLSLAAVPAFAQSPSYRELQRQKALVSKPALV